MEAKKTETHWKVLLSDNATPHIMKEEADGIDDLDNLVCRMPAEILRSFKSHDNAEFIVRACNAHEDLVAALQDLIGWFPGRAAWHTDAPMKAAEKARAALAKATK